jgi:hypothetical protein
LSVRYVSEFVTLLRLHLSWWPTWGKYDSELCCGILLNHFDSDGDPSNYYEMQTNSTDREREHRRCDSTVAIKPPAAVRQALERAAARDLCSISDIIRQATLDRLRATGLLDELLL